MKAVGTEIGDIRGLVRRNEAAPVRGM